jgi:hypothetical protein
MTASINPAALVDISSVAVDKDLPQDERYAEYRRQVKDTEHYKSKQFSITAVHPKNGVRLEDCLRGMLEY